MSFDPLILQIVWTTCDLEILRDGNDDGTQLGYDPKVTKVT